MLGNIGTLISFRVGAEDAPYLTREFRDRFTEIDLMQLPNHDIYLTLMIDGTPSKPFSATTLAPDGQLTTDHECLMSGALPRFGEDIRARGRGFPKVSERRRGFE